MKTKFTPFLFISIGLILLGLFYIFSGSGGNLGPLVGIVLLAVGILCLLPYFVLRIIFPAKIAWQLFIEVLLILAAAAVYYKSETKVLLHVPRNLTSNVIVVYGVDKAPKIQIARFYSNHIDVKVPASGIVLASAIPGRLVFVDSLQTPAKLLNPGYGIAFINDTMTINDKQYTICVFSRHELTKWKLKADSVKQVLKKEVGKLK